jgi:transketolase
LTNRSKNIRLKAFELSKANGGYHYGGSFSCAEILLALYDYTLKPDDRFILSKGHGCWVYYALLQEIGFSPKLEGHPHLDLANGIDWTTGSEGHGLPAGIGMALAKRRLGSPGKVYVLMGDGECQEGTTWESILLAGSRMINNLVVVVDNNRVQGSGWVDDILPINALGEAAVRSGWEVYQSIDGHNMEELCLHLDPTLPGPRLIIASTVKGKGVSFMENEPCWHAKWPDKVQEAQIIEELSS